MWVVKGSTCVGPDTELEREVVAFTFPSNEYSNPDLEASMVYRINRRLGDELEDIICESPFFHPIKRCLAERLYDEGGPGIVPYVAVPIRRR